MSNLLRNLLLSLALLPLTAQAFEVRDLYEAEVPVSGRDAAARADAVASALQQVLVKVSGLGSAPDSTAVSPDEASRYVQQYRYRQSGRDLMLWAQFAPEAVKGLLQQRGLPVWGGSRPLVLVWLAVEKRGERLLVGANDAGQERDTVLSAGKRLGLPVRLPLLDLSDQAQVQAADIWGDFHQPVLEGSKRYNPQAVLVGRLFPAAGGHWQVRWSLHFGDQRARWGSNAADAGQLIASGIEGAADRLSRAFAQAAASDTGESMVLNVVDVTDLAGCRTVLNYLQSLEGVSHVRLLGVDSRMASFELHAAGNLGSVVRTLSLGDPLVPEEWPLGQPPLEQQGNRQGRLYRLVP